MSQHTQIHPGVNYRRLLFSALLTLILSSNAMAQTTVFTYQGKLTDAGNPATGMYDMQFKVFDSADIATGNQVGTVIDRVGIPVTNGIFTVELDFGPGVFDGSARFLEIGVRPAGNPNPFTVLSPRQPVSATPYAMRSATAGVADMATNATQLGGLTSGGFIQNTTSQQASTNFNIGGTGTANILDATTQFNLSGVRMFAASGPFNDFAAINLALTNTFVGEGAGINTLPNPSLGLNPGKFNTFVGANAGKANTTATQNAFFGAFSGQATTQGFRNAFFGSFAGNSNTTGNFNSYFGQAAGFNSTTAFNNAFFGSGSGGQNTTGDNNAFFGVSAGDSNTAGFGNTIVGATADVGSGNLTNATAIGFQARVTQSNSLVLGRVNTNVGIGTSSPLARLHVNGNSEGIRIQGQASGNPNGAYLSFADAAGIQLGYVGDGSGSDNSMYLTSYVANVNLYTQIGAALTATSTGRVIIPAGQSGGSFPALEVAPSQIGGSVIANNLYVRQFNELSSPSHVCWRVSNAGVAALVLTNCTSSLSPTRAKTEMQEFSGGLDLINRLKPIAFKWKEGGKRDFGLNAEDVAEVEPLLVTRNAKGEVDDVKHDNLMVVFINAFKQQQAQIKSLQQEIETLMKRQQELDVLKALVCADRPNASVCGSN